MAGITGLGGSGMDIDTVVKTMVTAEQTPKKNQLDTVEKKATTQLTSLGQLKGAISAFQTALTTLNSSSQFLARTATAGDGKILSATASQSATAGNYELNVTQLAKSSKVALGAVSSDQAKAFNEGTLSISIGDTKLSDVTVTSSNNTLAGVRDAINAAGKDQGLSATIVSDAQGSRLVLASTKTGGNANISVAVTEPKDTDGKPTGSNTSLAAFAFDATSAGDLSSLSDADKAKGAGGFINRAQGAILTIDGLQVKSDTNTVSSAIDGLSIELKSVGSSSLTVAEDRAGVTSNVQKFADAYNSLITYVNSATKVTTVNDNTAPVTGALTGDSSVRSLVNTLRSELIAPGASGSFKALADLGVTTQSDGTLKVDSDKLDKAVSGDFAGVAAYFTGDTGLAARVGDRLKPYTDSTGILETRTDALQETLKKVDSSRKDLATRMSALSDRLYKQFNTMDTLFSQMSATSTSLKSLFDNMPGFVSKD